MPAHSNFETQGFGGWWGGRGCSVSARPGGWDGGGGGEGGGRALFSRQCFQRCEASRESVSDWLSGTQQTVAWTVNGQKLIINTQYSLYCCWTAAVMWCCPNTRWLYHNNSSLSLLLLYTVVDLEKIPVYPADPNIASGTTVLIYCYMYMFLPTVLYIWLIQ